MTDKHVPEPADTTPAATDPSGVAEAATDVEVNDAADDIRRERDDYHDRLLRKTAEFDNYRKRIERERREQADQAVVNLLQDVLLVVDDFDRALTVDASRQSDAYRKGVELIYQKLSDLLRRRGVRAFDSLGADFDPNIHQAVVHESSPDHREGEIIGEMQKGYMMGDRLLRPAMVKVAKA
jgi:molecular chaperone GrpE